MAQKNPKTHNIGIFTDMVSPKGLSMARKVYERRLEKNQLSTLDIHRIRTFLPCLLSYHTKEMAKTDRAIFAQLFDLK